MLVFRFLPEGLVPVKNENIAQLYAGMFLPDYKNLDCFRHATSPLWSWSADYASFKIDGKNAENAGRNGIADRIGFERIRAQNCPIRIWLTRLRVCEV